jgi:exodeoxyribonuclease-1
LSSSETFYWHDYETFGADPDYDRPVQFAGQRTDLDLNPVGEPLVLFARPPLDYLPQPGACLVTGITPQQAQGEGVCEADFITAVEAELKQPKTCSVGYNSLRFDDTLTRFTLYRNLRDPYAREYGEGRSRWDLIDPMRTAYALRPEGIEWPQREDGLPSFRLEDLTRANGLEHGKAHDALGDVTATIALAGLLRRAQPKLFDWLFRHRFKQSVAPLLDPAKQEPMLHVSGMFGGAGSNLGLILPLATHASNRNEIVCADLSIDATLLLELPAQELQRRLYTPAAELTEGQLRPGIKSVHLNRCPVVLPVKMADERVAARAGLDVAGCMRNYQLLCDHEARHPGALRDKLRSLNGFSRASEPADVDCALYSGGFIPDDDRATLKRLLGLAPEVLATTTVAFEDSRLEEMLFRYRARNYPHTLSDEERERWDEHRFLTVSEGNSKGLNLEQYHGEIEARLAKPDISPRDRDVLTALQSWGDSLLA